MSSRAWGTRYDTLRLAEDYDNPNSSLSEHESSNASHQTALQLDKAFNWSDHLDEQDAGHEDSLPSPLDVTTAPFLSSATQHATFKLQAESTVQSDPAVRLEPHEEPIDARFSREASVFIASLPSGMEHFELKKLLIEHLSSSASIQHVKIVRDQRGGPCAFVHVQDENTADRIIREFDATHFEGRTLHCERARAFRTLLVSFRTPPLYGINGRNTATDIKDYISDRIPSSMRIRRQKDNRLVQVLFNDYATNFNHSRRDVTTVSAHDALSGGGLLFSPLEHTDETIRRICLACGPIECFRLYQPPPHISDQTNPPPHDGNRSKDMPESVWEIKWAHRENATTAFQVLLQLPHICVSWAHQQPSSFLQAPNGLNGLHVSNGSVENQRSYHNPDRSSTGSFASRNHLDNSIISQNLVNQRDLEAEKIIAVGGFRESETHDLPSKTRSPTLQCSVAVNPAAREHCLQPELSEAHSLRVNVDLEPEVSKGSSSSPGPVAFSDSSVASLDTNGDTCLTPASPLTPCSVAKLINLDDDVVEDVDTIFVGNLPNVASRDQLEKELRSTFGQFGEIVDVRYITTANFSRANAFAFITFTNSSSRDKAIKEAHNSMLHGRPMRVLARDLNASRGGRHAFHKNSIYWQRKPPSNETRSDIARHIRSDSSNRHGNRDERRLPAKWSILSHETHHNFHASLPGSGNAAFQVHPDGGPVDSRLHDRIGDFNSNERMGQFPHYQNVPQSHFAGRHQQLPLVYAISPYPMLPQGYGPYPAATWPPGHPNIVPIPMWPPPAGLPSTPNRRHPLGNIDPVVAHTGGSTAAVGHLSHLHPDINNHGPPPAGPLMQTQAPQQWPHWQLSLPYQYPYIGHPHYHPTIPYIHGPQPWIPHPPVQESRHAITNIDNDEFSGPKLD